MENKIKFAQFRKFLTSQPFFIWNRLDDLVEVEDNVDDFWIVETDVELPESTAQVIAKTFGLFDRELTKMLGKDVVVINGDLDERLKKTKENLESGKILLNPAFEYNGAVSSPFAFDTDKKEIININYSKKTRRKDFIKAYYDVSIIKKVIEVKDYYLYLPKDKHYDRGEISLTKTNRLHPQKGSQLLDATYKDGRLKSLNVMETIDSGKLTDKIPFPNIDVAIKFIEKSRESKEINPQLTYDNTDWGTNSQWDELLEHTGHMFAGVSGNVFTKKEIAFDSYKDSLIWDKISKLDKAIVNNKMNALKIIKPILKSKRVVWYDFEGYSLPFAPLDGVPPYGQLVFQVSIIETENNVETVQDHIVVDPKTISLDDLFGIVEAVYSNKADTYVVYNKAYENTRIKEIVKLLYEAHDDRKLKAKQMYEWILENTVDLYDLFIISSKHADPAILLNDQKARASIKNVEKHITKNKIDLPRKITPYKELEVQNGTMAMNLAIERSLGIIGDKEWEEKVAMLKKYCENDVRAMIMVYDFVDKLLNES